MPELPEVESLRRALEPTLIARRVERVRVRTRAVVVMPTDPAAGFLRARTPSKPKPLQSRLLLRGCTLSRLVRHGKQLAIATAEGPAACIHLGMTGGVRIGTGKHPHTHVEWLLDDGTRLCFHDARRFGLVAGHESFDQLRQVRWARLGPDALSVRTDQLHNAAARSRRAIKTLLLDQTVLAGVGNIYADESLFRARICPLVPAETLSRAQIRRLARALREILQQAIAQGGSSIRDYRSLTGRTGSFQTRHKVYGRTGLPCVRCSNPLQSVVLSQRTTVYCPQCQQAP